MARTKAAAMAQSRALSVSRAHSHPSASPGPPAVRAKMSTTTKKTAAAKKSTANARAASLEEPEGSKSKYERYYESHRFQRKQDAKSWYERVGRAKRQEAAAARKAEKKAAKSAAVDTDQPAAVEESLAFITIRKVKDDMMVWRSQDGGFEVWAEWEKNDERRVELQRRGEMIWFRAISLFQHYEPPQNVDEAVLIYNICVEVMSMLRIGLQVL
ncbi:hypothetical protein C8J56DRAFT_1060226 [Mycena floridula]|nr:hypothetical protein C8J56DRAFT_1060226 [Mycena floridula]